MFERNREHPGQKHETHEKSHTPQCVIQCKELFSSSMEGFKDASPCLEISTSSERKIVHSSSGELEGDGRVSLQDVIVCMKYGSWGPKIHAAVIEGHKIANLAIKRLADLLISFFSIVFLFIIPVFEIVFIRHIGNKNLYVIK